MPRLAAARLWFQRQRSSVVRSCSRSFCAVETSGRRSAGGAFTVMVAGRSASVIVSLDDPWMNFAHLDQVITEVGIEPAQIHRLSSGGHHPHVESREYPERSARNLIDIVRVIDSMLVTASQPSVGSPSLAAPTVTAGTSTEGF